MRYDFTLIINCDSYEEVMSMLDSETILRIISKGEGISVEFKESVCSLNRDVYDTVSAFSNRDGGYILLGVKDDGTLTGIES